MAAVVAIWTGELHRLSFVSFRAKSDDVIQRGREGAGNGDWCERAGSGRCGDGEKSGTRETVDRTIRSSRMS